MGFAARFFSVIAAFILLFSFAKPTLAQQTTTPPNNLHNYTQKAMIEVMSAMICQLVGVDVASPGQPCLGIGPDGKIGYAQNNRGAIGAMGNLISGTFLIPVHSSTYMAYEASKFGFAKSAYAQQLNCNNSAPNGIGFCGLQPVLSLFTLFRNMAYILFVFIFVIVGVAIMLRVRIDPRTVMTVQNQIPKLIVGLVMITFAYAIAGFLIDLMWIAVYFVINTLSPDPATIGQLATHDPLSFVGGLFDINSGGISGGGIGNIAGAAANSINSLISALATSLLGAGKTCSIAPWDWGNCVVDGFASFLGWIFGVLAFLIFIVAIFVQLFKLWFALLKCFINVLLGVVLAPFWILAGLLPGASPSVGWSGWIRNLAGNLAPFPAILFLFLIGRTIVAGFSNPTASPGSGGTLTTFNPPLLGNITGTGGSSSDAQQVAAMYGALIALGFILSAPSIVEQVRKAFGAGALGGGLGGTGTGGAVLGAIGGAIGARIYYRDPRTGETRGPGANFVRNSQQYLGQTRIGRGTTAPFRWVGNSRLGKQFRRDPNQTTTQPEPDATLSSGAQVEDRLKGRK